MQKKKTQKRADGVPYSIGQLQMPVLQNKQQQQKKQMREDRWLWWCMTVIPALWRLEQEDCKFEVSLDYTASSGPT
jgi:hypothetical protein